MVYPGVYVRAQFMPAHAGFSLYIENPFSGDRIAADPFGYRLLSHAKFFRQSGLVASSPYCSAETCFIAHGRA